MCFQELLDHTFLHPERVLTAPSSGVSEEQLKTIVSQVSGQLSPRPSNPIQCQHLGLAGHATFPTSGLVGHAIFDAATMHA